MINLDGALFYYDIYLQKRGYDMKYILKKLVEKPCLYSKNNIVTEVNNEFMNLTGYFEKDFIGKSLTEISCMLKIDSQIYLENIENEYTCYMFTKEYEPIEVTISCKSLNCENVSDGVFISDKEGKYIKVNSKIMDICPTDTMKYLGDSHKINKYFDMLGNQITIKNMPKAIIPSKIYKCLKISP